LSPLRGPVVAARGLKLNKYECIISLMPKPSHREKLLHVGMQVVHERGFGGASVRDIVQAAGVPQGSFTNHFASKEAFGLEVIDLYAANTLEVIRRTLADESRPPLARLRAYLDHHRERLEQRGMRNGCLLGNFGAEASDGSEPIRERLVEVFGQLQAAVARCLRDAVATGDIAADTDCDDLAAWIVASVQGANLLAKTQRSVAPVERFARILFEHVLVRPSHA
jgi:TetR/AcrR family transcriptional repressor of nem operon